MKLNPDCIRDVLLYAEENADPDNPWIVPKDGESVLPLFTAREVRYHVDQCVDAGYLEKGDEWITDEMEILNLTFAGHQALATIRNPVIHEKAMNEWLSKVQDGLVSASTAQFVSAAAGILKNALLS